MVHRDRLEEGEVEKECVKEGDMVREYYTKREWKMEKGKGL